MSWVQWLVIAYAVCILVALGALAILNERDQKRRGDSDESWRDDYTGWG